MYNLNLETQCKLITGGVQSKTKLLLFVIFCNFLRFIPPKQLIFFQFFSSVSLTMLMRFYEANMKYEIWSKNSIFMKIADFQINISTFYQVKFYFFIHYSTRNLFFSNILKIRLPTTRGFWDIIIASRYGFEREKIEFVHWKRIFLLWN